MAKAARCALLALTLALAACMQQVVAMEGASRRLMGCLDPTGIFCSKSSKCPPAGFDAVQELNVTKYISAPWYIQEQMENTYQREDQLYCVRAKYEQINPEDLSEGLIVYNYANDGEVNGPAIGSNLPNSSSGFFTAFSELRAIIPDMSRPSKLKVGPGIFDDVFGKSIADAIFGPYWVVAVGISDDEDLGYDWAIISGGPPKVETDDGCRTGREFLQRIQVNGVGLWLFSRKPVDPEGTKIMRKTAEELGYDISVLFPVAQEGCKYEGAQP